MTEKTWAVREDEEGKEDTNDIVTGFVTKVVRPREITSGTRVFVSPA